MSRRVRLRERRARSGRRVEASSAVRLGSEPGRELLRLNARRLLLEPGGPQWLRAPCPVGTDDDQRDDGCDDAHRDGPCPPAAPFPKTR